MTNNSQTIENILKIIENDIQTYQISFHAKPVNNEVYSEITEAYQYPLLAGGKRIRPLLTLLCAGAIGGERGLENARPAALALECIHTYSLVHDDLPCMDNDDLRRGRPTTHKVYGEAKGLLVGDALLTEAFNIIATTPCKRVEYAQALVQELSQCAGIQGMVLGQWLDISLTGQNNLTWPEIERIHRNKTGKLLGCCFALGLISGLNVLASDMESSEFLQLKTKLKSAGELVGISFQIIDDILDTTQSSQILGKTAGKDSEQQKYTAVTLLGVEKAQRLANEYTTQAFDILRTVLTNFQPTPAKHATNYKDTLFAQIKLLLARKY